MLDTYSARSLAPVTPSQYAHLRVWLTTSPRVPAPPYAGAQPPSPEQAHLLLSLTCHAGIEPAQLARMRLDALVASDGTPDEYVHIRAKTTKNRVSRKVAMHPDIRRDVKAFRSYHVGEDWVAFVRKQCAEPNQQQMSEHGLSQWLVSVFRNAGFDGLSARSGPKMFRDTERRV